MLLAATLTYGANLLYLTALNFLSVCKFKATGFTLYLLLGIELVMIAVFTQGILLLLVSQLIDENSSTAHIDQLQQELYPLLYAYWLLDFVALSVGPCIFWIFSTKYWSVALKFELVVQEKDINESSKLVNTILYGGIILFIIVQAAITALSM